MTKPDGERIAVLEAENKHIMESQDKLENAMKELSEKIDDLNKILERAKGAKWALVAFATLGGGTGGVLLANIGSILKIPFLLK